MKVPLSWLKDFVDITLPIDDLAQRLTGAGLEVEAIHFIGLPPPETTRVEYKISGFEWDRTKIVVGAVLEVLPHPDADRLVLCRLDDGVQVHTVLTGAANLFEFKGAGPLETPLKVCYAREGAAIIDAYLPGDNLTTLKRKKIRGVESYSMACSERELGISPEHEGIILLDPDAPVGTPLQDYLGDAVLDIAITPNIARNANVAGIAREIAALTGAPFRAPADPDPWASDAPSIEGLVSLQITEPEVNPRFVLGLIEGIAIGPSPYLVQYRLRLAGQRPINNVVDATNYAMLELGEPLHAFDYDILLARAEQAGAEAPVIITRRAEPGEKLQTLDGEIRTLDDFTVLVCDQSGSLALAGVMGGLESEVTGATTRILLEGASWNMINTRRTQVSQKLHSEAGYRFSRGVHPSLAPAGVRRGLMLMADWAGGRVAKGLVDEYPQPPGTPVVELTPADVDRWLGLKLGTEEIVRILTALEFDCRVLDGGAIRLQPPDFRLDIGTGVIGVADVIEEIARIYGYDRIPETRMSDELPPQRGVPALDLEERVRNLLVTAGFQEIITYRMTTPEAENRRLSPGTPPADRPYVGLLNPINRERTVMRQSLLASALETVERNARLQDRLAVFEIGEVFYGSEEGALPEEHTRLALALGGRRDLPAWQGGDDGQMDFYDLKGVVAELLDGLHIEVVYEPGDHPVFHPGKCAHVTHGETRLGTIGELHPETAARYDFDGKKVLAGTFSMEALLSIRPDRYETLPVPTYPPVIEDLALIVPDNVPAEAVDGLIRQTGGSLVTDVTLFDLYRGAQIEPGKKSLAYRITYQAPDRTLTDEEVEKMRRKIVGRLEREVGARLRG
ncbi:MAG TPA: phenylalanine--tRNA ligase subunit beta [Anaerolineales bacterium]|nr:phenylalanine--tRNA ligase subunit beta [Anaerolineales bacterium]